MIEIRLVGNVRRDVPGLSGGDGQRGQAAAAQAIVQPGGPLQQPGVQIKDVGRIRLSRRRPAQEQRNAPVGVGVLRQIVVDDEHVPSVVHEVLADRAGGVRRQVLLARRRIGVGDDDHGIVQGAVAR